MPYGDELVINLKGGQKIYGYNTSYIYLSSNIKARKKVGSLSGLVRRSVAGEESRLVRYEAQDNGEIRLIYDKLPGTITHDSIVGYQLDSTNPHALMGNTDDLLATSGNVKMKLQFNFKGMLSKANVATVRFDLESGDIGNIWMNMGSHTVVNLTDGENIMINIEDLLFCIIKNKKSYNIIKKFLSIGSLTKDVIEIKGPAKLFCKSHDFTQKEKIYRRLIKYQ